MLIPKTSSEALCELCNHYDRSLKKGFLPTKRDGNIYFLWGKFLRRHNCLQRFFGTKVEALNNWDDLEKITNYSLINGVQIINSHIDKQNVLRPGVPRFYLGTEYKITLIGSFQDKILEAYAELDSKEEAQYAIEKGKEQLWMGSLNNYKMDLAHNRSAYHKRV